MLNSALKECYILELQCPKQSQSLFKFKLIKVKYSKRFSSVFEVVKYKVLVAI